MSIGLKWSDLKNAFVARRTLALIPAVERTTAAMTCSTKLPAAGTMYTTTLPGSSMVSEDLRARERTEWWKGTGSGSTRQDMGQSVSELTYRIPQGDRDLFESTNGPSARPTNPVPKSWWFLTTDQVVRYLDPFRLRNPWWPALLGLQ